MPYPFPINPFAQVCHIENQSRVFGVVASDRRTQRWFWWGFFVLLLRGNGRARAIWQPRGGPFWFVLGARGPDHPQHLPGPGLTYQFPTGLRILTSFRCTYATTRSDPHHTTLAHPKLIGQNCAHGQTLFPLFHDERWQIDDFATGIL